MSKTPGELKQEDADLARTRAEQTAPALPGARDDPHGLHLGIAGQTIKVPMVWQTVYIVLIVAATLVVMEFTSGLPTRILHAFTGSISKNSEGVDIKGEQAATIFEFWTPSEDTGAFVADQPVTGTVGTLEYLNAMHPGAGEDEKANWNSWYRPLTSLGQFEGAVLGMGATGFTRTFNWGRSAAIYSRVKPGWTWRVTFRRGAVSRKDLMLMYGEHFSLADGRRVYVEEWTSD